MTAQWPLLVGRLVALLPTLPGWGAVTVYDGPPVTSDSPTDYCSVGYVNGQDGAGMYTQVRDNIYPLSAEQGDVRCELVCWTGDVALPTMRARVFALADALDAAVRADQTLGVLPKASTTDLAVDVQSVQNGDGSAQRLLLTVSYFARS